MTRAHFGFSPRCARTLRAGSSSYNSRTPAAARDFPRLRAQVGEHCSASVCESGSSFDIKRQELERVFSHSEAASTSGTHAVSSSLLCPVLSASEPLRVQVGGGPEPPKQKREERHDDYYANVGDAIRTLREDVPTLFTSELNYDIYTEDVVFKDPRNCFRGIKNYKTIFWSLRFHGNLFFKDLYVEVKRIWQKTDDTICLRWTVHGFPRLPWDQEGTFDGVSTYKLDSRGKIYEHKVDNVIMGDPPAQGLPFLVTLNLSPAPAQQPFPTPCVAAGLNSVQSSCTHLSAQQRYFDPCTEWLRSSCSAPESVRDSTGSI